MPWDENDDQPDYRTIYTPPSLRLAKKCGAGISTEGNLIYGDKICQQILDILKAIPNAEPVLVGCEYLKEGIEEKHPQVIPVLNKISSLVHTPDILFGYKDKDPSAFFDAKSGCKCTANSLEGYREIKMETGLSIYLAAMTEIEAAIGKRFFRYCEIDKLVIMRTSTTIKGETMYHFDESLYDDFNLSDYI
jgi:hypothetical protein